LLGDAKASERLLDVFCIVSERWTWKWQPDWNDLQMSFRVIKSGTNRKL